MKNIFLISKILLIQVCFAVSTKAEISVDFDITAKMRLETLYSYTNRPRIKCGRVDSSTKGPFARGPFYPATQIVGQTGESKKFNSEIYVNVDNGSQEKKKGTLVRKPRSLNADVIIDNDTETEGKNIKLTFADEKKFDEKDGQVSVRSHSSCIRRRRDAAFSNPSISGYLNINYQVPSDIWLLKVEVKKATGIFGFLNIDFSEKHRGFKKSLNPFLDQGKPETLYVWVKPETTITKTFVFNEAYNNNSIALEGEFEISIIPDKSSRPKLTDAKSWFVEYPKRYQEQEIKKMNLTDDGAVGTIEFIKKHIDIFNSQSLLKEIVSSSSIFELESIFDSLAKSRDHANLSPDHSHIRIASTILSYKLAEVFLADLIPFCEASNLKFPYKNIDINLNWLSVINYLVMKSSNRIKSYNINAINSLVDIMYGYQEQGLTYSDIRNNNQEYEKILKAYQILAESMDLRSTPLKQSNEEIKYLFSSMGDKSANLANVNMLLNSLDQLSSQEDGLIKELVSSIRLFQPDSHEIVNMNSLKERVGQLGSEISQVIDIFDSSSEIFSTSSSGLQKINEMIFNLGINYIAIFEKPFETNFEFFRKEFFEEEKILTTKEKLLSCLGAEK